MTQTDITSLLIVNNNNNNNNDVQMSNNNDDDQSSSSPAMPTTTTTTTNYIASTTTTSTTTPTKKRKKLTEEEVKQREDEKKKKRDDKEEEKRKREEEKKKKEDEKKKKDEEREAERKKKEDEKRRKDEEKRQRDEERENERKKKEEERRVKDEERENERKKKEEEKRKKEEEREATKKKREDERRQQEEERKRLQEEQEKKQPKLTQFFAVNTEHAPKHHQAKSDAFIQPVELPPNSEVYTFKQRHHSDAKQFDRLVRQQDTPVHFDARTYFNQKQLITPTLRFRVRALPGSVINPELIGRLSRLKLLKFHDNQRPSYFGTFSRATKLINGRKPFSKDTHMFDYSYDSGDEWEADDEEAENIASDDEVESEEEEDDDDQNWIEKDEDSASDNEDHMVIIPSTTHTQTQGGGDKDNKKKKIKRNERIKKKRMIIIDPSVETTANDPFLMDIYKTFTVESLVGECPIIIADLLAKSASHSTKDKKDTDSKQAFPVAAIPMLIQFVMANKKRPAKVIGKMIFDTYPGIKRKLIMEKIGETCVQTGGVWSVKEQFEHDLQATLDEKYPLPIIPEALLATDHANNTTPSQSPSKANNNNKKKQSPTKKKTNTPVQSNSLLSYFTKLPTPSTTSTTSTSTTTSSEDITMSINDN
ncbi:hypothetical protein SAMD00019534_008610 [Acytostelium subglobosum LB1]|uniref:hypothetical protein n=1 Tax=Acytostelium subglobosum LB1 TaxID=1410327 RepID=UPI000644E0EE|nr:hypothetical protein SAMD00019534_008610 [Acytostelium subglobosum LB1]GAM17686.1 hypothetical protein SAMD00019534_008610 [Acytostelium subglobosum LB1]|eukprot:XP_012758282.1 hypothetical protein SAMD00019534_008610 [Acytostelium subglobosum LB1]